MATSADSASKTAVFHFRADPELLQQVKESAAKHQVSVNYHLLDAVKVRLATEKEWEWREGFEGMGRDPDMNVEYLLPVAREMLFGRERDEND